MKLFKHIALVSIICLIVLSSPAWLGECYHFAPYHNPVAELSIDTVSLLIPSEQELNHCPVPQNMVSEFVAMFQNCRRDILGAKWKYIAEFQVVENDGTETRVSMFMTHEGIAACRIGDKYYRGGTNEKFQSFTNTIKSHLTLEH